MKVLDVEQGSRAWVEARLGIPTASAFKRIITSTGKLSAQRERYQAELLAEWVYGEPAEDLTDNLNIARGKALEPEARRYYSFHAGVDATTVGFCVRDDGIAGASPDGLVNPDGLLELKCPRGRHPSALLGARRAADGLQGPSAGAALGDRPRVGRLHELLPGTASVPHPSRAGPEVSIRT